MPVPPAHVAVPKPRPGAPADDAFYPSSDGRPMADNTWQAEAIMAAASDLAVALPEPFVAANILVYLERGDRDNRVAPDVLVAFGVGRRHRMSYFVWQEGKPPDWVLEVASPRTEAKDRERKRQIYEALGVPEYWLFDPMGLFPRGTPRLQGLALAGRRYEPLPPCSADGVTAIPSAVLGLHIRADGLLLRFRDPATGQDVRHHAEAETAAVREAARAEREAGRAEREAAGRKAAQMRAEQETERRRAAEVRAAELEAALRRLRTGPGAHRQT